MAVLGTAVAVSEFAGSDDDVTAEDALRALRARGIDRPDSLLEFADPAAIVATCLWWDRQRGVGTGLLVSKLKKGGIDADELQRESAGRMRQRHEQFDDCARRFPEGSVIESHADLGARSAAIHNLGGAPRTKNGRLEPGELRSTKPAIPAEDRCGGALVVLTVEYPLIEVRCDVCGYEAAYPWRARTELPLTAAATGRPEPAQREPNPERPTPKTADLPRHPKFTGLEEVAAAASSWLDAWKPKRPEAPPQRSATGAPGSPPADPPGSDARRNEP